MKRAGALALFSALGILVLVAPWPVSPAPAGEREVIVRARQYAYTPGVLRVPEGVRLTLVLEADDVTHGVRIDDYGIDLVAEPGSPARATFMADRRGTFRLRCSTVCGSLHPFMLGELVVEPNLPMWRAFGVAIVAAAGAVTLLALRGEPRPPGPA